MHYTRILMGIGGAMITVAMFRDPFRPEGGVQRQDGLESWQQVALWGAAGGLPAATPPPPPPG